MALEYLIIVGFLAGSRLFYVPSEKNLYVSKAKRGDRESFICYQCILRKQKNDGNTHPECKARVVLDKNGILTRNHVAHSDHNSHENIYADMKSANTIKDQIRELRDGFPEMVHKIRVDDIYLKNMAGFFFKILLFY